MIEKTGLKKYLSDVVTALIVIAGIIVALILATSIAFWLEKNNEKTFQSLNQSNEDVLVQVIRNGHVCQVPRKDIVVGDIVKLDLDIIH